MHSQSIDPSRLTSAAELQSASRPYSATGRNSSRCADAVSAAIVVVAVSVMRSTPPVAWLRRLRSGQGPPRYNPLAVTSGAAAGPLILGPSSQVPERSCCVTQIDEMACNELVEVVTEYLEGTLAEEDRQRLEAHLEECPYCVDYVEQFRETIAATGEMTLES